MKIDRLVSIIVVLLRQERVQAKELADRFEVSVRTILRDVDAINMAGIPITTWQGSGGGIGIAEGFKIDRSVLTGDEMATVITALKGLAGGMPDDGRSRIIVDKFMNAIAASNQPAITMKTNQLVIDITPWGGNGGLDSKLDFFRKAIEGAFAVDMIYADGEGRKSQRKVYPYALLLKGQKWYLYAWCTARNDFRLFKLIRIRELEMLEEKFHRQDVDLSSIPWESDWGSSVGRTMVEMVFDPVMNGIVQDWFAEDNIEYLPDGRIHAVISLPENNWMYGFILSFGPCVEVISPPHIRNGVASMAEEVVKKYSSMK